jgi:hypothetical protein
MFNGLIILIQLFKKLKIYQIFNSLEELEILPMYIDHSNIITFFLFYNKILT